MVTPLALALMHQAMAMIVLTIAAVHAASIAECAPWALSSFAKADASDFSAVTKSGFR
jgi:hypothetical protein